MFWRALLQENRNAVSRIANAPAELLQLRFQNFVIGTFNNVGYARLKRGQPRGNRVGNKFDIAHPKLAAFAKIRFRLDCGKKFVNVIDEFRRESHANRIAHYGEKSFARARIVEALDRRSQSVLRYAETDLLRRYLLERVRLIENNEIIRKQKPALPFFLHVGRSKQNEQKRVIEHDHVRRQQTFTCLLIETTRVLATGLLGADMRFAAHLRPNFWIGFDGQITERSIPRCARPFGQPLQFAALRAGEKFLLALQCSLEAARAKIILPTFH